jgi:hypothetical protein
MVVLEKALRIAAPAGLGDERAPATIAFPDLAFDPGRDVPAARGVVLRAGLVGRGELALFGIGRDGPRPAANA